MEDGTADVFAVHPEGMVAGEMRQGVSLWADGRDMEPVRFLDGPVFRFFRAGCCCAMLSASLLAGPVTAGNHSGRRALPGLQLAGLFAHALQKVFPGAERRVSSWQKWAGPYRRDVGQAAQATGVPPSLIAAVLRTESHAHNAAVSSAGAIGPMQLMPATARNQLHINPWNPRENILGGARYLKMLLLLFHQQLTLALEAYNAGPTRISLGEIPPASRSYAQAVQSLLAHGRPSRV